MDFAQRIYDAMKKRGYLYVSAPGELEIVYIEDCHPDGRHNPVNKTDKDRYGDARVVLDWHEGRPRIRGAWYATTQPGPRLTFNPVAAARDKGAANIELGQHPAAWTVDLHRGSYEALCQRAHSVTIARDKDKNFQREGDERTTGWYGINQHHGGQSDSVDPSLAKIAAHSAGCLVTPRISDHVAFMFLMKTDPRYQANKKFAWRTTVMSYSWLEQFAPVQSNDRPASVPIIPRNTEYKSLIGGFFSTPTDTAHPPAIRFNNPGAINGNAEWVKAFPGFVRTHVIGGGNPIAIMYTPEQGVALFWTLLKRYRASGAKTIKQVIIKYGGGQANYESQYLPTVVKRMGLSPDTEINLNDDALLLRFSREMFRYEAGKPSPLSDAQIMYGFKLARGEVDKQRVTDGGKVAVPVAYGVWHYWDAVTAHPVTSFMVVAAVVVLGVMAFEWWRNRKVHNEQDRQDSRS